MHENSTDHGRTYATVDIDEMREAAFVAGWMAATNQWLNASSVTPVWTNDQRLAIARHEFEKWTG